MTARAVVVDIEGTTSSTASVHVGLYDYARPRLEPWIEANAGDTEVAAAVATTISDAGLAPGAATADVVAVLHSWMDADLKATPLKTLQGQIWAAGFAAGELAAHVFADVAPRLRAWHADGVAIAVYSSGSVASQRAWFAHTDAGDLSGLIVAYFDTVNAGAKRDRGSYAAIAASLGVAPPAALFLSDVPAELDAAVAAGWRAIGVRRAGRTCRGVGLRPPPGGGLVRRGRAVTVPDREELLAVGARLAAEAARFSALGWMRATSGNLSEVLRRDPLLLAVTASGRDKGELRPDDVAVVDARGEAVHVPGIDPVRPSAEAGLHAHVAAVTGARSVVHVHTLNAVEAAHRWPDGVVLQDLEMLKALDRGAHGDVVRVPVIANSQDMRRARRPLRQRLRRRRRRRRAGRRPRQLRVGRGHPAGPVAYRSAGLAARRRPASRLTLVSSVGRPTRSKMAAVSPRRAPASSSRYRAAARIERTATTRGSASSVSMSETG